MMPPLNDGIAMPIYDKSGMLWPAIAENSAARTRRNANKQNINRTFLLMQIERYAGGNL
ncbi:hypothetical protein AAKU55_001691 [Oxalobacteraceae bacterium GrIS 1.11]